MTNQFGRPTHHATSGPSRLWYLLAVAVLIAGMAGMGVFLSSQLSNLGDDLMQIVVPGETELALEPGSYTIYHESQSTVDGRVYSAENISGLGVTLTSATGEPITLTPAPISSRYSYAGRSGRAAFAFEILDPGAYLLTGAYREGTAGPETVVAIGKEFGAGILRMVLGALALAFAGVGLALVIGWRVFVKRRAAANAGAGQVGSPAG
ncbi:MAG: hypothetical protein K5872_21130 [Rhizobiaceae bacterium]|nr:hypothetical protein [Rhizobiaceae bacterium]MCV0408721.1 hypothetical protein [Rhizobiaceae bacterium]